MPIFSFGVCFIHTKNYRGADERFGSAVRLKPAYGYKIGGQYQKAGTEKLNKGQIQSAINLYDKAIKYQPNLKNKIAMQCKTTGLQYLEKNKLEEAVKPLQAAAAYQPQLSEEIAKIFFDKANAMLNGTAQNKYSGKSETERSDPCYDCYELSLEFSNKHREGIKKLLSGLYNTKGIPAGHKAELRRRIKTLAKNDEEFKALAPPIPPNFIVLKRGSNKITLKAGEITKKWITIPNGTRITGIKSADNMFKFIYPDGTEIEAWTLKRVPNKYKFKLQGVTNQNLNLIVG